MKANFLILAIFSLFVVSRADADDIATYAAASREEVAATKQKLKSKDGIFNDFNYKGTIVRPAKPEDRTPASADASEDDPE